MASNADLSRWGAALGHAAARVVPTKSGARFVGECSCGYKSTTRTSQRLAVDALIHHLYKVIRDAKASGWVPPAAPAAPGAREAEPVLSDL